MTGRCLATALLLAITCATDPSIAQDHLEPVDAASDTGYRDMLRDVFAEARIERSLAQAIIIPSFTAESSVSIYQRGSDYTLLVLKPRAHLWRYVLAEMTKTGAIQLVGASPEVAAGEQAREVKRLLAGLPEDPRKVRLDRCSAELDGSTAGVVLAAWRTMLGDVRKSAPEESKDSEIIVDGTSFLFWRRDKMVSQEGETYGPERGRAGDLAELASVLVRYCDDRASDTELRRVARRVVRPND